jgi:hypothetical protein
VNAVNQLLKQFGEMRKMMRQMGGASASMPGPMGKMAALAARAQAQRSEAVPAGFESLAAGMSAGAASRGGGGAKNKKKKGGRVTPPKQR